MHLFKQFIMLLSCLLVMPVYSSPITKRDFVIDTDMAIDDAIAIVYMLGQPGIQVKAITIEANGNARCKPAYNNVLGILALSKQTNIPVACGRETPLYGNHHFPKAVLDHGDSLGGVAFTATRDVPSMSAKALMIETLKKTKTTIDILAIAPLTTLAEVISEEPALKEKIRMIYVMGGALQVAGNIHEVDPSSNNTSAEWNLYIDPLAAHQVFSSGIPITLVPLDVTNQAPIKAEFIEKLKSAKKTPASHFVYQMLDKNRKLLSDFYFWDPLTAVIAADESVATFEALPLTIALFPEERSGATIIDKKHGKLIRFCQKIKVPVFEAKLLQGLSA